MKILIVDDQHLILVSLQQKLSELGYEVQIAQNGADALALFDGSKPDLVIIDINMPGMNGVKVIEFLRIERGSNVSIIIVSALHDDDLIVKCFDLGIDDFMHKPVSMTEVAARVQKIAHSAHSNNPHLVIESDDRIVDGATVGVVIPCYNEAERLTSQPFLDFVDHNIGYHFCFVNDGSKDQTLSILQAICNGREEYMSVFDCPRNGGKAEAVRQGVLHLVGQKRFDYIGYLDADLSTNLEDFDDLANTIQSEESDFKIVSGSRIARMGADIEKESARKIISKTINLIIQRILDMPFKDTQCGAKVMTSELAEIVFADPFVTRWIFDVEIFLRMKKRYGTENAIIQICEQPLDRWVHADGSKLSMKDSITIVFQLVRLAHHYR